MVKRVALCWLLLSTIQSVEVTLRADDRLSLSLDVIQTSRSGSPSLQIAIQNTGVTGTVVNLGKLSLDGKVCYPTAIRVRTHRLRDAIQQWDDDSAWQFNELHYGRASEGIRTGRDFLVPIAPGGAYVLKTPLADWRHADDESTARLKPGTNSIKVELNVERGRSVNATHNASQENRWHGRLESRHAAIVMPAGVPRLLDIRRSDEPDDDRTRLNGRVSDPSMSEGQRVLAGDFKTIVRRLDEHQIEVKVGRSGTHDSAWVRLRLNQGPDGELTGWATLAQHTDTPAFDDDFNRVVCATDGDVNVFRFSDRRGDRQRNVGTFRLTFGDVGNIDGKFSSSTVLD